MMDERFGDASACLKRALEHAPDRTEAKQLLNEIQQNITH